MTEKAQNKFNQLRQRAEELISQVGMSKISDSVMDNQDMLRLLHELEVHQMELELQHRELQQTNKALNESRDRYKDLFEQAPAGYVITDYKGIIQQTNLTFAAMLDIERDTLRGMALTKFVHEDDKDTYYLCRRAALQAGTGQQCRVQLVRPSGKTLMVDMRHRKVDDDTLRCSIIDISEIHRAEVAKREARQRQQELNELKRRMIVTLGHELRTPLSSILLSAEMLERYNMSLDEKAYRKLTKIKTHAQHLMSIIQEVVSSNPYEIDLSETEAKQLSLRTVVDGLVEDLDDKLRERVRVHYTIETADNEIYWDKAHLGQLLTHVLMNALRYSHDPVDLSVMLLAKEIIITVEDTGRGIPDGAMLHIYELFYRAENVENISGIGIGLTVVRRILALHDGDITIDSTFGEGTTVTLTLPRHLMQNRH